MLGRADDGLILARPERRGLGGHLPLLGRVFSVARQGESVAILLAVGIAVGLHGVFSSNQILFAAGVAYTSIVAMSAATLGGRELMQTR